MRKAYTLQQGLVRIGSSQIYVSVFSFISVFLVIMSDVSVYTFALLMSAVLHESGHILALYLCKEKPKKICIYPFGVDMKCSLSCLSYQKELFVLLSGSFTNIFISFISLLICCFAYSKLMLFVTVCNAFLGLSNLIPINGLDGGRALYAFLCMQDKTEETVYNICRKTTDISYMIMSIVFAVIIFLSGTNFSVIIMLSLFAMGAFIASHILK